MKPNADPLSLSRDQRHFAYVVIGMRWCIVSMLTFIASGATCIPRRSIPDFQPVPIFDAPPTRDQLANAINRTRNIQSLQSSSVNVTLNNERSVNANMTWARPRKFRMTASVAGVAGFDLGSNEELFWMTVRYFATTPDMYFARHDAFEAQVDRHILPVSPVWLIEALGVNDIDLSQLVQEPVTRADGLVEMTTYVPSPIGNYIRTLAVDPKYGYVKQVFLRDPTSRLVANAQQSKHQYYPSVQTSLPHSVKAQLIPAGDEVMELDITIAAYVVNGLPPDNMTQFEMPDVRSYNARDLAPGYSNQMQAIPPIVAPPQSSVPRASYRGVEWDGPIYR